MLHQVLKKFKADGRVLQPGEIIETSHWKNERLLREHRFIGKPSVPQKDAPKVEAGANAEDISAESSGVNSEPESPKTVPTSDSVKPAKRKPVPVVGRVPVATKAK